MRYCTTFLKINLIVGIFFIFSATTVATQDEASRDQLEQELTAIEQQITDLERELSTTKNERQTLTTKIKRLKNEQTHLRLQIKATNLVINNLEKKLDATQQAIEKNRNKQRALKERLARLLKLMNQKDQTLVLFALSAPRGLADIFVEMKNYEKLSVAINSIVQQTKALHGEFKKQQVTFTEQQSEAERLLEVKTIQQQTLSNHVAEQASLLKETQGKESVYTTLLSDTKKRAAEVRNRIYELFGGAKQISFGEAVTIAEWVSKQTEVRPAFLLAILTQESNLGKSVGTCNRANDPEEKSWKVVMKPERDHQPFLAITEELGLNPDTTPISCPMRDKKGKRLGWGGAMGPAQFIPSTWLGYKDKVSALTGKKPANPWDIRDAFVASAIKLKNDGSNGTNQGDWKAAMRYFSGSINVKYRFYGDNVIALTERYENDIKTVATN